MDPTSYPAIDYTKQRPQRRRIIIVSLAVFAGILLLLIGWAVFRTQQFRIVSTDPSSSKVAAITATMTVNFSRPVSSQGLAISSDPKIVTSYKVNGRSVALSLGSMDAGKAYTITLDTVSSTNGAHLTKQSIHFTTQDTDFTDLPNNQQQAILDKQAQQPVSQNTLTYTGLDSLTEYGVTSSQYGDLQQAFFEFIQSTKSTAASIVVDPNNVNPVPHNPESTSDIDTINFVAAVGDTSYNAKVDYSNLTAIRLYLYDQKSGAQKYDSGTIDNGQHVANPS